jgi:hypothetical protein|tara:strand:- start:496 stop:984 length:489 start_codon:yes stop_codon:yes gene_type:complete
MIEYVTKIDNFWKDELATHTYKRRVLFDAKNFDHLDRVYYNKDYILQSFNDELNCSSRFKADLNAAEGAVSWTCILPDVILPTHKDTFYTLRQEHNVPIEKCFRYIVFLEDAVFGHSVNFTTKNITNFAAGDVYKFDCNELHYGVNASNVAFHTCQVSTFLV